MGKVILGPDESHDVALIQFGFKFWPHSWGLDVYIPWAGRRANYGADHGYLDPGSHNFWLHEPLSSFHRTEEESALLVYDAWQKQHHSLSL